MVLSDRLKKFNYNLSDGEIDWKLIFCEGVQTGDSSMALDILVDRGFVELFPHGSTPTRFSYNWYVKHSECKNTNPSHDGKVIFFKSEKYAKSYATYLRGTQNFKSVEVKQV